jgi:p-cumate 2,3-dioxygenase subunit beta
MRRKVGMKRSLAEISLLEVEGFFYSEANLLDRWELQKWLSLFREDALYIVPTTDLQKPDPGRDMTLICDSLPRLRARVAQLLGGKAWAENPPSRTRRIVTNVMCSQLSSDTVLATANFMVHRFRHGKCDTFIGRYEHDLAPSTDGLRIRSRRAILDHETLTPHGMVSFIL